MATFARQPFGDISTPRLQALGSSKNSQNALSPSAPSSVGKRQREPDIFDDDDCENADPAAFTSPTKKSRTSSHGFVKPARFSMGPAPARSAVSLTASPATSLHSTRKPLSAPSTAKSLSAPNTAKSLSSPNTAKSLSSPNTAKSLSAPNTAKSLSSPNTARSAPISHSRGSPKNKRLHAVSKRRASTSPYRRVDPPSFAQGALPFSIDAALSGTIANYTPKSTLSVTPTPAPAPQQASALDESMPKAWFFDIHEDTPEQEAANLMEHSASVLDISSDDDAETKAKNEDLLRGKENVPPPDFALSQPRTASASTMDDGEETEIEEPVKRPRLRKLTQDAMDEDRRPLGDLPPSDFYAAGCDATSYVTVDTGIERPSRLSKQVDMESASENVDPVKKAAKPKPKPKVVVEPVPAADEAVHTTAREEPKTNTAVATAPPEEEDHATPVPEPTLQPLETPSEQL